jgi:hypothetical protein
MRPRLAVFVGIAWIIDVIVYWAFPYVFGGHIDYAGMTMLFALSIAMSVMFYVLIAGTPRDEGQAGGHTDTSGH